MTKHLDEHEMLRAVEAHLHHLDFIGFIALVLMLWGISRLGGIREHLKEIRDELKRANDLEQSRQKLVREK